MKNPIFLSSSQPQHEYLTLVPSNNDVTIDSLIDFESSLEDYLGEGCFVAALHSGTSALHLALIMAGVSHGDEVLCQSFTFSASANPIVYQGATPIFIDSEQDTWNLCPKVLEEAIQNRIAKGKYPKAIIVVHLYGMPAHIELIQAIAQKYGMVLIEDAAEALGARYQGQACGTFGDFGIVSFNTNKIISTFGGGGLICKTKAAKEHAIFLATQARDTAPHYQHTQIGYNYRMSPILARIGIGQMEVLDKHIALRRQMHQLYQELFTDIDEVTLFTEPSKDCFSNHWLSCILLKSYDQREALRIHLEQEGIESRPLWKPMHLQPVFANAPYYGGSIAEELFKKGLCLPSGSNLTDEDRSRIRTAIHSFFTE